ncbi:MAG: flagellar hook capping FlgD N-terminal domain-containing protein [Pseudomonadota bacterium]
MDTVNPAGTAAQPASNGDTFASALNTSSPGTGDEFNNFLQLLTAQVQNQDPLSPLDSTQFVEQLATFSALEQQVETNSTLGTISAAISDIYSLFQGEAADNGNTDESSS